MGADFLALYGAYTHTHNIIIRHFTLCSSVGIKKGAELPGLLRALYSPAPSVTVQSRKWNNEAL